METGLFTDWSYDKYAAVDAIRATQLKDFHLKSGLHAHYNATHQTDTPALVVGNAIHCAVLEPERYADDYAVAPKCDRRTKAGKATWAEFEQEAEGRILLKEDEGRMVTSVADAVRAHSTANEIVNQTRGLNEVSAVWEEDGGLYGKARVDRLCEWRGKPTIVDLKSTQDASPRGFGRAVVNFGYHIQLAWYARGLNRISPTPRQAVLIALEKTPPYAVAVYTMDVEYMIVADKIVERCLDEFRVAKETGAWSGYATQELFCPEWLARDWLDE